MTVFTGCLWHGCPQCYPDRTTKNPKTGQTMDQMYALAQIKRKVLTKDLRFNYVCIWEHEWLKKIQQDPAIQDFVASLDIQDRLDARNSFFGGRTNAVKLHYKTRDDERIKYVDFTRYFFQALNCFFTFVLSRKIKEKKNAINF